MTKEMKDMLDTKIEKLFDTLEVMVIEEVSEYMESNNLDYQYELSGKFAEGIEYMIRKLENYK